MFLPPHLVHSVTQMFGDMRLVAVGFRHVFFTEAMYGSHVSIATARMPLICSSVSISQKPSKLESIRFWALIGPGFHGRA